MDKEIIIIDGEYEGHSNEEIISLNNRYNDICDELKYIEKEIREIRNSCKHTYQFAYKGMYKDIYICNKCGHEIEK